MHSRRSPKCKCRSKLMTLLLILSLVLTSVSDSIAAPPLEAKAFVLSQATQSSEWRPVVLRYDPTPSSYRVEPPIQFLQMSAQMRPQTATIVINYLENETNIAGDYCYPWDPNAQTAFEYTKGIWESLINSSVTIQIDACWAELDPGVLGYSGADAFYRNFANAPESDTWYQSSLANAISGSDLGGVGTPDMHIAYSRTYDWYFGTDGQTPSTEMDFVTVVLHEIAHGLGFSGSMNVSGGQGSWGGGTSYPVIYDRFAENGAGQSLINTSLFPNPSTALAMQLTSNNIYFDGTYANAANGGTRPKLYAPSTWNPGSSYAHLDYDTYNDTVNGLMVWAVSEGESTHDPGPVTMGILRDLGWTLEGGAQAPTVTSITPNSGPDTGVVDISNLAGANFQTGATVKLTRSDVPGGDVTNGDFENGPTDWTEYSTHGWDLIVQSFPTGVTPHSGSWAVWLGGDLDDVSYIQQQVTVPSGSPYLSYWHWIASEDTCGYDYGSTLIDGSEVDAYDLCSSENTGGWVQHTVDLSAYEGQSVSLQIRAETDSSANSNLFVDDVTFQSSPLLVQVERSNMDQEGIGAAVASRKRDGSHIRIVPDVATSETFTAPQQVADITIDATDVVVVSDSQITCRFDLTGAATGQWDVVVTNPDTQSGTLPDGFTVLSAADKVWNGNLNSDWHTADNWTPTGVPGSGDDVLIPNVTNDPVISAGDAAVNSLIINSGAIVDLTDRALTVEGTLTNNGTLKQTQDVVPDNSTEFLRITNSAGDQTKYYGVNITPQDDANVSSHGVSQPVELTLDSLPARSATPHAVTIYVPDTPVSLVVDDGVHESAFGVNNETAGTGKQFIWLNRFTPEAAAYPFTLEEIWVMFDSFGGGANVAVGDAIDLVVYEDSDGDPTNGATWLATIPVTVQAVDGTVWSVYSLSSPILLEGPGDVIIAAINRYVVSGEPPMCYPATVDTTVGQDRSWIGWWVSDPPSPAVLPPDLHFELLTGTSPGNWLVRGYGSTVTANTPPAISGLPDQLLLVNDVANNAIDLWAYASDNESPDDALTFTIDNTPDPGAGVSIDSNRYIDIFPATDWTGQTDVIVRVEDPEGLFDTDSFQVTVSSTLNTTPTISGLPDQWLLVNEVANNAIDLWAYASDNESPDDALTFTIDNTPDPGAGVGIDSNRYIDIFPDTDWVGQTDVVVRVEDPEGFFDTDSFQVTVSSTVNTMPTISALPDITVPVNSTSVVPWMDLWDYADDAEDSDDQLTFSIANTPNPNAGVSIDSDRYILVVPATNWVGVTDVEIQVQDTGGLTDTDTFQVTITGTVNTSPTISGLPDQTLPVDGIANNAIDLWAYASDNESPDDALTFTIDNTPDPGAGVRIDSNRYIDIFPDTGWEGQTDVIVRVEDPEGLSDTDSFHVTIGSGVPATSVTVAVSGNQFCANRTTGVERCFDIDPATPISATVRFYFSEAERNGQLLDDLLVFHYDGDWMEEPGPYIRGGAGDAQYVEAQNVDDFSPFVLDSDSPPQPDHYSIYLPLLLRRWPPIPDTPVLNPISNDDGDGDYTVTWNAALLAETYTLEESSNAAFSSPTTRYTGSGTSWSASDKSAGTYYYRVRASRLWNGQTLYSTWSNIQSVVVQPPVGAPAGFWEGQGVEFYVTPDKAYVDDFAIYISVSGCGNYKIQRPSPVSLTNNQFSFSGAFYASGTLNSTTTASGNAGLDDYFIYGCGDVTGSFSWTANWVNDSQPSLVFTEVAELEKTDSAADSIFVVQPAE